jgi:tRNA U34 2-thiouridine synthase MnmA/TrmU
MEMVKKPKHAMGKNMNPCIDCRIFTLRKAKEFMQEIGASFIVTGEVLGERPLSQRRDAIKTIDKESNLEGLILRPLSAKLLEPTMPEKAGIIDRERLLDISGRRRIHQISLAKRFGLNNYQNPAGGCLLTDKGFSGRLEDLLRHNPDYDISDLHLLKVGRHFRISDGLRFIVGRDEKENERLMSFARDGNMIFDIPDIPSPIGLARGKISEKDKESLASILVRYSDCNGDGFTVSYRRPTSEEREKVFANPASQSLLDSLRI